MADQFDLLSIGDSTVDIFSFPDKSDIHCQLHGKGSECELCLAAASKVPTRGFALTFGGNAANCAVGTSRLGLKTSVYTYLGNDLFGKEVLENFKKEKVDTSQVVLDSHNPTNVNVILSYGAERTILTANQKRDYKLPKITSRWVYFSSLAPGHEIFHNPFDEYLKKDSAKIIFNPGSYQIKEGLRVYRKLLFICEALILNLEEAGQLLGSKLNEKQLLLGLHALGPKIVVITDGPHGSHAYNGTDLLFQEASPLKAIERTGAGDAFSSGFTSALIFGKPLKEALKWGTANGGAVTQKVGAQAGLLTKEKLEEGVKKL